MSNLVCVVLLNSGLIMKEKTYDLVVVYLIGSLKIVSIESVIVTLSFPSDHLKI